MLVFKNIVAETQKVSETVTDEMWKVVNGKWLPIL